MTNIVYTRFSPRPKHAMKNASDSLDIQKASCHRYCEFQKLDVDETIRDEATSARTTPLFDRPGGKKLSDLPHGSNIIVMKLDRIFRNVIDGLSCQALWLKQGVSLHIANQGGVSGDFGRATGKLMMTLLLSITEFEAAITSERTAAAMHHSQKLGKSSLHPSKLPYGLMQDPERDGYVIECPEESDAIQRIMWYSEFGYSHTVIHNILKDDHPHFVARDRQPYSSSLIAKIIKQQSDPEHWAYCLKAHDLTVD